MPADGLPDHSDLIVNNIDEDDASDLNFIADIEDNEPASEPINVDIDKSLDAMQLEEYESDGASG